MKKPIQIVFFFLLSILAAKAQTNGNISGKVVDTTTKEPIPYVNIVVKDQSKILNGGITDDKGNFTVKGLPLQGLTLEIQYIGYKTYTSKIELSENKRTLNLGNISITEEATTLEGVEVVREKSIMEQKVDRKVINVGKDLISAGATAGELMNNIPSVSVDAQTNEISLRGNSNVRILVDGKPTTIDPAQLLKQIPSASIKQIELITNPSAKYNPEGMSGMINIILHKNANLGFNGSINTGLTFGVTPKANASIDMNYKVGKVNFFGNYGFNTGVQHNHGYINGFDPGFESYQDFTFKNDNTSNFFKVGLDYYIDEKNTISVYTNQSFFKGIGSGISDINYFNNTPSRPDILQDNNAKSKANSPSYNFDFKHDFTKKGENIEFEINFSKDDSPEYATFSYPYTSEIVFNDIESNTNNTVINLDYTNPITEKSKLEVGLESRIDKVENKFDIDKAYNSAFAYDRKIFSGYATFGTQWEKWGAQVGLRAENYQVEALFKEIGTADGTFKDDIFAFYPNAFVTYNPSEKNAYQFSYSRRVDRPSIGQVNPIREWSTPTVESIGNPELEPQFTNSYEINYTRKTKIGSITTGIFYRQINDEITRTVIEHPTEDGKHQISYDNFDDNKAYGIEISGNLNFTKWWSANISTDAYFRTIRGVVQNKPAEADVTLFNARINNTFTANKNLRFQWFYMYRGKDLSLQFTRKPMWRTDIGASYNVLKGKGTLSARVSDIFDAMNFAFVGDNPFKRDGAFYWESQTIYVGFNYRFGGGKNRAIQRKQRDTNETQGGGGMM